MGWTISIKDEAGRTVVANEKIQLKGSNIAIGGSNFLEMDLTYNYSTYYKIDFPDGMEYLNGKDLKERMSILVTMKNAILKKYQVNGKWKTRTHYEQYGVNTETFEVKRGVDISPGEDAHRYIFWYKQEDIDEGDDSNYWKITAKNAINGIDELLKMASYTESGKWSVL